MQYNGSTSTYMQYILNYNYIGSNEIAACVSVMIKYKSQHNNKLNIVIIASKVLSHCYIQWTIIIIIIITIRHVGIEIAKVYAQPNYRTNCCTGFAWVML